MMRRTREGSRGVASTVAPRHSFIHGGASDADSSDSEDDREAGKRAHLTEHEQFDYSALGTAI